MESVNRGVHAPRSESELPHEIVSAIARADDVTPTELTPPLASVVDLEAVARVVESSESTTRVTFEYSGYVVAVGSDSGVTVGERDS